MTLSSNDATVNSPPIALANDCSVYVGGELEVFAKAITWKQYCRQQILPFLGTRVLEVGAGIGGTTKILNHAGVVRWMCLEPDPLLARHVQAEIENGMMPRNCEVVVGTLADVPSTATFDTIIYSDVLEHILDDAAEVRRAIEFLDTGGHLIVIGPAHNFLFTPFDKSIGHFRRYNKRMLTALAPSHLSCVRMRYLDSVGTAASLANRLLLRSSAPTQSQILFWDRVLVRLSRSVDRMLFYSLGKSIVGVWRRDV
ncbi:MAG: class I SAM-dependent methyltransferase [Pirellulaceae bacterium]